MIDLSRGVIDVEGNALELTRAFGLNAVTSKPKLRRGVRQSL